MASRTYAAENSKIQSAGAQVLGGDVMDAIRWFPGVTSGLPARGEIHVEV